MMKFILVMWVGMLPNYFGDYQTKDQCWAVVQELLTVGVGSEKPHKFQCIEVKK